MAMSARLFGGETPPPGRPAAMDEVIDFALLDQRGRCHELRRTQARAVVLFFAGNGCPVSRQTFWKLRALQQRYAEGGVAVWVVNSMAREDRAAIAEEAATFHADPLPVLKDDTQGVARLLGVERTGETVVIGTKEWRVLYQGAFDNEFGENETTPVARVNYTEAALGEFLAGKPVVRARTIATGTAIAFGPEYESSAKVSYAGEVAPILLRKCAVCHRPGDVGSWVMSDHPKVKGMSAMIREVLLARRMPPWGADPIHGKFSNDGSLAVAEARTLLHWIEQGSPRGEGEDPLPAAAVPAMEWPLGKPDHIVRLPRLEQIPATGTIDLRHQVVEGPFDKDTWVNAVDFNPGNRKVLHHVTLRTIVPGQIVADPVGIAGWNPGYTSRRFPAGTGQLFRKGTMFHIDLHYTTVGTPQTDRTEIGFYVSPAPPKLALEGRAVWDAEISIPPGEPDARVSAVGGFDRDTTIYNLRPHMHWRGSWFRFEMLYPDGRRETLLSVPRYDFNWQGTYVLSEPKRVPAGSWMLCTAGFDNSPLNPANPDPSKRLRWGEQSSDEMFIGHFDAAPAP